MKQQPVFTEQFDGIPFPFWLSLSYSTKRGDKVVSPWKKRDKRRSQRMVGSENGSWGLAVSDDMSTKKTVESSII